jgi:hypothetical protein
MKTGVLVITMSIMAAALPAGAQEGGAGREGSEGRDLPPITVVPTAPKPSVAPPPEGGGAAAPPNGAARQGGGCADATAGSERSLGCVNEMLKRKVDSVNPITNTPPIDAKSPDTKTGVVNIPAVQQQYGKNFGISAVPYRPPAPTFVSPMTAHH